MLRFVTKGTQAGDEMHLQSAAHSRAPSIALLPQAPSQRYLNETLSSNQSENGPGPFTVSPHDMDLGERQSSVSPVDLQARGTQAKQESQSMSVTGPLASSVMEQNAPSPSSKEPPALASALDLKSAVEEVRSATFLLELSLDGERFQYVSPVWKDIVGIEPIECIGVSISTLLYPADEGLFKAATKQLLRDDSHTVELRFRLRVHQQPQGSPTASDEESPISSEFVYEIMEGKGMLMHDRDGSLKPSHTM